MWGVGGGWLSFSLVHLVSHTFARRQEDPGIHGVDLQLVNSISVSRERL